MRSGIDQLEGRCVGGVFNGLAKDIGASISRLDGGGEGPRWLTGGRAWSIADLVLVEVDPDAVGKMSLPRYPGADEGNDASGISSTLHRGDIGVGRCTTT